MTKNSSKSFSDERYFITLAKIIFCCFIRATILLVFYFNF
jgi:hypothetical protein